MRFVIYSHDLGVYLGNFLGLGFWSKVDPVGQPSACTFDSEQQIREHVATWDGGSPPTWRAVPVEVDPDGYATIAQCVAAGLPGWDPEASPC